MGRIQCGAELENNTWTFECRVGGIYGNYDIRINDYKRMRKTSDTIVRVVVPYVRLFLSFGSECSGLFHGIVLLYQVTWSRYLCHRIQ